MEIIVILSVMLGLFAVIALSFCLGFAACDRYHRALRAAQSHAVKDYREKENALFLFSQQEVEFYKRNLTALPDEVPLKIHPDARRFQNDTCVAFAGKKSQF